MNGMNGHSAVNNTTPGTTTHNAVPPGPTAQNDVDPGTNGMAAVPGRTTQNVVPTGIQQSELFSAPPSTRCHKIQHSTPPSQDVSFLEDIKATMRKLQEAQEAQGKILVTLMKKQVEEPVPEWI